jgi:hypothetical protein
LTIGNPLGLRFWLSEALVVAEASFFVSSDVQPVKPVISAVLNSHIEVCFAFLIFVNSFVSFFVNFFVNFL